MIRFLLDEAGISLPILLAFLGRDSLEMCDDPRVYVLTLKNKEMRHDKTLLDCYLIPSFILGLSGLLLRPITYFTTLNHCLYIICCIFHVIINFYTVID